MHVIKGRMEKAVELIGPMIRAKAKELAAKAC